MPTVPMPDLTAFSNLFQTLDVLRSKTEPDTDTQSAEVLD